MRLPQEPLRQFPKKSCFAQFKKPNKRQEGGIIRLGQARFKISFLFIVRTIAERFILTFEAST